VKRIFLVFIAVFYFTNCFAQDTVERKNKLSDQVFERYHVLKNTPQIKDGTYKAYFKRKIIIAVGNYNKDMRVGLWHFYNRTGRKVETFNYDENQFTFEGPLGEQSDISFLFDDIFVKTDTVTRPLKIGGSYYGFIPYVNIFRLPFETEDINIDAFTVFVELLVSPGGRLADYKVHVTSDYYNYSQVFTLDLSLFSDDDKIFIPAAVNHKPILSRVFIRCSVNTRGGIDFY
jgi:hypothetical protein